jgi:hypothetical protein
VAGSNVLREFFIKLGLDVDEAKIAAANLAVDGVKKGLEKLADAALGTLVAVRDSVAQVIGSADAFDEASQAIGVDVVALQELTYAAGFSGMALEDLKGSLAILTRNMSGAASGNDELARAFRRAGVDVKDAKGNLRAADDVLMDLAETFSGMENGAEKTALALKIFGKSGAGMIPFLNAGRTGIGELRAEAQRLGIVMDDASIAAGAAADDAVTKFRASVQGFKTQVIAPLLPLIVKSVNAMARLFRAIGAGLRSASKWWRQAIYVLGSLLLAVLVKANGGFIMLAANAARAGLAMLVAGVKAAAGWALAAAPILAIAALIGLVILVVEDLYYWLTGGESFIGKLWAKWTAFIDDWTTPKTDDPWWLKLVKFFIYAVHNLGTIWDGVVEYWAEVLGSFFDWIEAKIDAVVRAANRIKEFALDVGAGVTGGGGVRDAVTGTLWTGAIDTARNLVGGVQVAGGGSSPAASAATSGRRQAPIVNQFNAELHLSGDAATPEGQSKIREMLDDWFEGKVGSALAAQGG